MLLEELNTQKHVSLEEVNVEYNNLLESFKSFLNDFANIEESHMTPVEGDVEAQLHELSRRFDAARRGLGLVNKLSAGPDRTAHARRIMSNLNTIRAQLSHVARAVQDKFEWEQSEFQRASRSYEHGQGYEQEEMSVCEGCGNCPCDCPEEDCPICLQSECICS